VVELAAAVAIEPDPLVSRVRSERDRGSEPQSEIGKDGPEGETGIEGQRGSEAGLRIVCDSVVDADGPRLAGQRCRGTYRDAAVAPVGVRAVQREVEPALRHDERPREKRLDDVGADGRRTDQQRERYQGSSHYRLIAFDPLAVTFAAPDDKLCEWRF